MGKCNKLYPFEFCKLCLMAKAKNKTWPDVFLNIYKNYLRKYYKWEKIK